MSAILQGNCFRLFLQYAHGYGLWMTKIAQLEEEGRDIKKKRTTKKKRHITTTTVKTALSQCHCKGLVVGSLHRGGPYARGYRLVGCTEHQSLIVGQGGVRYTWNSAHGRCTFHFSVSNDLRCFLRSQAAG